MQPDNRSMGRKSLLEFFGEYYTTQSECLIFDDGYRRWGYSYAQVARGARIFAARLQAAHIGTGEKIILWSENRPRNVPPPGRTVPSARFRAFLAENLGYITNEGTGRKMVANGRLDQPCDPSSFSGTAVPRARETDCLK